jgi:hypothetical protein
MPEEPSAFLDAWRLLGSGDVLHLVGLATGHPRLPGRRRAIRTSPLIRLDLKLRYAQTRHTTYHLGRHLDALIEDEDGQPHLVAAGGLTASRRIGTDCWLLSRGEELLTTFEARELKAVLDHLLDLDPPVEDLIFQITPANLHRPED